MKLIVGLGNPGIFYQKTRHNIGASTVKTLASQQGVALKKDKYCLARTARVPGASGELILAIPLSYMNLSGGVVASLVNKYNITPADTLIACDDLDLEFGRIRMRSSGSSGGHRGLQSIIAALGREDFCRIRLGIGRPQGVIDPARFVLSKFTKLEQKELRMFMLEACACIETWAHGDKEKAMNMFNRKKNCP
ncbi:MAG: aminoacyl-tRNA hydrolase [Candidatus Omnitrophica bacterium]|nr:aminoacyl-tRNA hydrolase [Candidatus Omnitrophota bacterium]